MVVSQIFGGPYNKGYSVMGSILGSPHLGKFPYELIWGLWGLGIMEHQMEKNMEHGLETGIL